MTSIDKMKTDTIIDPVDGPLNGLGTLPADELRH
jgi:hypothetical protein